MRCAIDRNSSARQVIRASTSSVSEWTKCCCASRRHDLSVDRTSQSWWPLVAFILLVAATASLGAMFQPGSWYTTLAKPSWTPPSWLFGPVWTVLYIMIAIAGWLVWREGDSRGGTGLLGCRFAAQCGVVLAVFRPAFDRRSADRHHPAVVYDRRLCRCGATHESIGEQSFPALSRLGEFCDGAQCGHLAAQPLSGCCLKPCRARRWRARPRPSRSAIDPTPGTR